LKEKLLDRRWYSAKNYDVIEYIEPKCWYVKGLNRTLEYNENSEKIWDCGYIIIK